MPNDNLSATIFVIRGVSDSDTTFAYAYSLEDAIALVNQKFKTGFQLKHGKVSSTNPALNVVDKFNIGLQNYLIYGLNAVKHNFWYDALQIGEYPIGELLT